MHMNIRYETVSLPHVTSSGALASVMGSVSSQFP